MLQTYLDEQAFISPARSLAEVVDAASAHAAARGRVIIEVRHNGIPLAGGLLADTPGLSGEIRLRSASLRSVLGASMGDANLALDSAVEDQRTAALLVHQGETTRALASVGGVIASWQTLTALLEAGGALGSLSTFDECRRGLTASLESLRSSVINQDWSALGDILEYDLVRQADAWRTLLTEIGTEPAHPDTTHA